MGLYCCLDIEEKGYPLTLSRTASDGSLAEVDVDYSEALMAFGETFLDIATDLVPVDTGYLRSTLEWESDGFSICECWADCEYAEYVEYGTWKMDEQPYFRPAIEEAWEVFVDLAGEAKSLAEEELEDILSEIQGAAMGAMEEAGIGGLGGFVGGTLMFAGMFVLMFPIMVNVYGIIDSVFGNSYGGSSYGPGSPPEIEIT